MGREIKLKYGNTNTFYIPSQGPGTKGGLLIDTDYAATLSSFYRAIKQFQIELCDITYVLATHYHPDHMGLISELMKQGATLILMEEQKKFVHFSDHIFKRDKLPYQPIDDTQAIVLPCKESRAFLSKIGIHGEILHTPSHSEDSISLILDDGSCFVGDLEPYEYLEAYEQNESLKADWDLIFTKKPKHIFYAHMP